MTKEFILGFLEQNRDILKEKFSVKKIGLFGSYANGSAKGASDIDIVVDMQSSFDDYFNLKEFLESKLHKTVDLALENSMRELIKREITKEVIYV